MKGRRGNLRVERLGTIGEHAGVILLEVEMHRRGAAAARRERFVAVDACRPLGNHVIGSLGEVKPNFASGLTTIDGIVRQEVRDVDRRCGGSVRTRS
jgi:hypothetical protein